MANEDLDLDVEAEGEEKSPKSSKKLIIIIVAAVLVLIIAIVGGMFAMGFFDDTAKEQTTEVAEADTDKKVAKKEEQEKLAEDAIYWPISPAFVMNFEGKSKAKYMQIELVAMSRSQKSIDTLKKHMPAIRNELTFFLGSQKYVEMVSPEGKEQLRSEIIETINNILKSNGAGVGIENILFTSFVMQ